MSLPIARARRKNVPSSQRSPYSSTLSHSRTLSAKPSVVMSQASWSCSSSQASLTSRISDSTRAKSWSRRPSPATARSTYGSTPRSTRVLAGAAETSRRARRGGGPRGRASREISLQRRAPAGPQLAVRRSRKNSSVCRGRARPGVEHRLAVLDHQHRVAGLVAGQVHVRGVRPEPVVGVVGAHLELAGRDDQPLARERVGQRGRGARPTSRRPSAGGGAAPARPIPRA